MLPADKLQALQKEFAGLHEYLADPAHMADGKDYREKARRHRELEEIMEAWEQWRKLNSRLEETQSLLESESDEEMQALEREEIAQLEERLAKTEAQLDDLLIPSDPNDAKNAIVEIRAGTGGEEAALFVADLFRMYSYFADRRKWKLAVLSSNETGLGGFKEIIFQLSGKDVYGTMRFESGVHRVQRIPVTEAGGRIHTSAVSVAVLPEAEEIDLEISESDLRTDVYRSSGHGGQSVNTTDSAVRITHLPTGLVVTCQDEKSQIKNKAKALKVLRSRLLDLEISKQEQEIARHRKAQVSTGDRSAKIRTYNFPQSRVTDHRINLTTYNLDGLLSGEIDEFIEALKNAWRREKVSS